MKRIIIAAATKGGARYNVYTFDGVKVLTHTASLDTLEPGVYIVNGKKTRIN